MGSQDYDAAIKRYSDALTLEPTDQSDIYLKRSRVRAAMGSWEEALDDADKVWIVLLSHKTDLGDPSYLGYRARPIILSGVRDKACGIA